MVPKVQQLAEQFWYVKSQFERWAGRVGMVGAAGVHFHEFINSALPPRQALCGRALLPLSGQGTIAIVLQAHESCTRRDAIHLGNPHPIRAQVPPHGEKIRYVLRLPGLTHHHDARGRVTGSGRLPVYPEVASGRGICGDRGNTRETSRFGEELPQERLHSGYGQGSVGRHRGLFAQGQAPHPPYNHLAVGERQAGYLAARTAGRVAITSRRQVLRRTIVSSALAGISPREIWARNSCRDVVINSAALISIWMACTRSVCGRPYVRTMFPPA